MIVAVPVYLTQIQSQIDSNHKVVESVIDICNLTDPDFIVKLIKRTGNK